MAYETLPEPVEKAPRTIDVHVGSRVRLRRTRLGMTQEMLGERLGLTFQQVHKYERGANRVGASRLFDLAHILNVPVSFFFDNLPEATHGAASSSRLQQSSPEMHPSPGDDLLHRRETLEVVRAYYRITDPAVRKRMFDLVKSLGSTEKE